MRSQTVPRQPVTKVQRGHRHLVIYSSDMRLLRYIGFSEHRCCHLSILLVTRVVQFQVAPLWFGAQLAFNFSLSMTNVTSNTILSSTSGLFTYVLSCLLLGEAFNLVKLLSILICITGALPFQIACVCKVAFALD